MENRLERILVTGGLGFIGSAYIRLAAGEHRIVNVDAHTYAADAQRIAVVPAARCETVHADLRDAELEQVVRRAQPDVVVHFAAETHVTRSELDPDAFFAANVEGTGRLLDVLERQPPRLLVHVSTDEVYGPAPGRPFREQDKLPGDGQATSAYAKSKALAEDLVRERSARVPAVVVRPTNCYGPWQHPEKAIPRWTARALDGQPLPVWGDGGQTRQWLHVDDACSAIAAVIAHGEPGEVYNIAPPSTGATNLEMAQRIAELAGAGGDAAYLTAYDRPGHDRHYLVDATRMRALGWEPAWSLDDGLERTVAWYASHRDWWTARLAGAEALYADTDPRGA
jgi:dTDP-glucose 4,6-dehydratase